MFFISEIWRHIWRNKGRSLLSVCIAALLISFIGLYKGNIQKNEATMKSLANAAPITVQVTNRNGSRQIGLEIPVSSLDSLLSADITEPIYTAQAGGNLEPINQVEYVKACDTAILGTNSLLALPFVTSDRIDFVKGWDETFLKGDKSLCIISEYYAAQHNISLGDTLSFPLYTYKYNKDGASFNFITVGNAKLKVIGIYRQEGATSDTQQMLVPVNWLRLFAEENGAAFYYDSARFIVKNPLKLNDLKEYMKENYFGEVNPKAEDRRSGDKLIIQDKIFIETANKLLENINMLRWFQLPFYIIIILLILSVAFLTLRSYRKEMAIASSLGRPKLICAVSYYTETLFLYLFGCILVLPMLMYSAGIGVINILMIYLLFLVCASIGIWIALILLSRFDTITLLTKID